MRRRDFVAAFAATGAVCAQNGNTPARGRLKQCVTRFPFDPKLPLEDMCREAAQLGCVGFDLVQPKDWPTLRKYGLRPTMAPPGGVTIQDGIIHTEKHDAFAAALGTAIDECAAGGCPNIITVGGQRHGMGYTEGADNAVTFLNRMKARAEDKGVTICMEVMNSKYDRIDQICDHVAWGVDVVKRVNSPRVKILFDVYHAQIMDGDICRNIQQNFQWIAHFHVGGVPGRHEIDETQELNYRFIAKTIADLGYSGYIAHEFYPSPGRDPVESLRQAIAILNV
ncbi:MAG TPA: TIM barrel protein [Bryobacteraceae bacterium]|nr:TIM barrel protein [Bryobacteraceae bacterium]